MNEVNKASTDNEMYIVHFLKENLVTKTKPCVKYRTQAGCQSQNPDAGCPGS